MNTSSWTQTGAASNLGRFNDPFSLTITEEIIDLIADSWADDQQPTPFEVYLKVCHSLAQDARDGMGYVLPTSMSTLLLDYQESAVRTLSRRIVRRGGTMLGDVVGLGKTLTAVATALMLQAAEDYSTLVLCPKNLEPMWTEHLDAYDINGRVVPYSMVDKVLPELKRFNLVICDESHNLRNNGTIAYEAIHRYIRANGSKVQYRTEFAADLKRMLPRIPLAATRQDFEAFTEAGRKLSDLHVNYESVDPYPLHEQGVLAGDPWETYRVTKMRWADKTSKTALIVNQHVTLGDIPADAHRYMLGSRSAIEWLIDRYQVKTDKASGIVNDPNDWGREHGDPRYIVDLVKRVVRVSVDTMRIVDGLPKLPLGASA